MSLEFSAGALQEIEALKGQYPDVRALMLPALHLAQREFGHVSLEAEQLVAETLKVPLSDVHEAVTFYTLFHRTPPGEHVVYLCRTLSCWMRGADPLREQVCRKLGVHPGETSADRKVTVLESECLGACEQAPVALVDGDFVGPLDSDKVDQLLERLRR
ncbi:MAG TPA: NAD(P)H-dependent oxidoreductase subunit E [Acidobacteriota bacterium]